MDSSSQTCAEIRELYLTKRARTGDLERHAAACEACAAWLERQGFVCGILGTMDRLVAPLVLEGRVSEDLQLGTGCLSGVLQGLERRAVPEELEQRLVEELGDISTAEDPLETPSWAPLLATLEPMEAPRVLDRLVDEELADAPASVARRFAGGLFRMSPPKGLSARIAEDLGDPAPVMARRWWLPLGSVAAAVLLVFSIAPLLQEQSVRSPRPFRVVDVESLASLDPLGRSLVNGLAGGRVHGMERTRETSGDEQR